MKNANYYKDLMRKEVEYERVFGQVSELARQVDQKDGKINELHKRIEELLRVNAASSSAGEARAGEI